MTELRLAEVFEKKFRLEFFWKNDSRAYSQNDALIQQIKGLLLAHPFLFRLLSEDDYSMSKILNAIADYFSKIRKERMIQENMLQQFIITHQKYRITETLTLLLMLGFSFRYCFTRITNNQTKPGHKFIYEMNDEAEGLNLDYYYIMPQHDKQPFIEDLYRLIEDPDVPSSVIEYSLDNAKLHIKNNKMLSPPTNKR